MYPYTECYLNDFKVFSTIFQAKQGASPHDTCLLTKMTIHYFSDSSYFTVKVCQKMKQMQPKKWLKICKIQILSAEKFKCQNNNIENCA